MSEGRAQSPLLAWLRRSAVGQAAALTVLALLMRLLHLRFMAASPLFQAPTADEWENWSFAARLADGNWLGEGLGPYFRPQLFAYVLAGLQKLMGGSVILCHVALVIVDAATVGVTYLVLRRIWPRRAALIAAGALALFSPALFFAATFNKESFGVHLQAWMLLSAVLWIRSRHQPSGWKWAAAMGASAGLGLLTRPAQILPTLAVLAVLVPGAWAAGRAGVARWGLCVGLIVGLLGLGAWRNFAVGRAPILYSTNGWLNLYLANNGEGLSWMRHSPGVAWDLLIERPQITAGIAPDDYRAIDDYWKGQFLAYASRDPDGLARGLVRKLATALHAREIGAVSNLAEGRRLSPPQAWTPGAGVLYPVALAGVTLAFFRRPGARFRSRSRGLLLGAALSGLAALVLVHPTARDRLAVSVLLILFVAETVVWFTSRRDRRRVLAAGALTLGLALIVNRPTTDAEMDRFEAWAAAVNRGDAHLQLHAVERQPRDLQAAIAAYGEARRIRPEGLQPLKQLPAAYFRQGDPQAAGAIQEELVGRLREEWPRNRLVRGRELATLAQLAVRAGDGPRAERAAREWRSLEPESLGALDALVTSFILQQRGPQAVALAEERYRRVPDAEGEELLRRARALP